MSIKRGPRRGQFRRALASAAVMALAAAACGNSVENSAGATDPVEPDAAVTGDQPNADHASISLAGTTFEVRVTGTNVARGEPLAEHVHCLTFGEDGSWNNRYHSDNATVASGTWTERTVDDGLSFTVSATKVSAGFLLTLDQTGAVTSSDAGMKLVAQNRVQIGNAGTFESYEDSTSVGFENSDCVAGANG